MLQNSFSQLPILLRISDYTELHVFKILAIETLFHTKSSSFVNKYSLLSNGTHFKRQISLLIDDLNTELPFEGRFKMTPPRVLSLPPFTRSISSLSVFT